MASEMGNTTIQTGVVGRFYPEREESGFKKIERLSAFVEGAFLSMVQPRPKGFKRIVRLVNSHGDIVTDWDDNKIFEESRILGSRLRREGYRMRLVAQCFALVREVARRRLGIMHFDVQLMGGWVLLKGMIAEMETGEGKSLVENQFVCDLYLLYQNVYSLKHYYTCTHSR